MTVTNTGSVPFELVVIPDAGATFHYSSIDDMVQAPLSKRVLVAPTGSGNNQKKLVYDCDLSVPL